jgi:tetratricopeptide (TPR) repeat protein
MIKLRLIAVLAASFLLTILAQAQSTSPSSQQQSRRTVYVLDIHHEGVASQDDIDDFAEQLLILRLGQLKSYNVEKRERNKEPQCTSEGVVPANLQQVTIGSDANHYVVKATIITREPEKGAREAVLNYELLKCRRSGEQVSLAQNNHTFPYTEVLSHLNSMADAISFQLEQEQEVTKISIDLKAIAGPTHGAKLRLMFLDRLTKAQEFEPRDVGTATPPSDPPAEYTVSGRVFTQSSKLWFEIEIRNRRGRSFKKIYDGPTENETDTAKLEEFYQDKSLLALDYLTFVRNIADQDQPPPLNELEAEKALEQAQELLCKAKTSVTECVPQASPAADLLAEVVRNKKFNTWTVWELLGGALIQANENRRAAQAFENAARLAELEGKTSVVGDLLGRAGSAWVESRNLEAAGSVYDRLLKLSPSSPEAHLGRAKSYRYNDERLKELSFLLDSLEALPDAKELKEELEFLAGSLLEEEIGPALKILESKKEKPSAAFALGLLRSRVAKLVPLIYIQVADEDQRGRARKVQQKLQEQGYLAPGIEIVTKNQIKNTQLRHFHDDDTEKEDAQQILKILNELGVTAELVYASGYKDSKNIRSRQYEIWLGPDF